MRTKVGTVTSAKMKNTVTIVVHTHAMHPIYKKRYRMSKKFMADTNGMDVYAGDLVEISECRPLSKNKHFKVTKIVQAAPRVSEIAEESELAGALQSKTRKEQEDSSSEEA